MSARLPRSAPFGRGAGRGTAWRRRSAGVAPAVAALLVAALTLVSTPMCIAQPSPLPPPPAAPVTVAAVAACPAGTTLTGASTVTYTVAQFAGIGPASLASGINAALASSPSVTGLEKAGVTADSTGALFSSATGLPCGFVAGGVLNRTGLPVDGSGVQVLINSTSSLYLGTPVTLVCSSCITWTAPPTVACGPTHRYSGNSTVAASVSYTNYFPMTSTSVQYSGAVLNMTDVGSTPTGPALATQLPLTGVPATIQQVRSSRGVSVALQC